MLKEAKHIRSERTRFNFIASLREVLSREELQVENSLSSKLFLRNCKFVSFYEKKLTDASQNALTIRRKDDFTM